MQLQPRKFASRITLADGKGDRMEGSVAKNFEEGKSHEHFLEVGHHARKAAPFCRF
jgi:hypothetical protein